MIVLRTLIVFLFAGTLCAQQICDLAPEYRQKNWGRPGSCGHASTTSALRWVQLFDQADDWRKSFSNGENFRRHCDRLRAKGIAFVATSDGDERILEYATWSRRGAVVYWPSGHITNFMGKRGDRVVILDNNHVGRLDGYPYADWVRRWQRNSGCAIVIVSGEVPPPIPTGSDV